jgi:hypothetical protein
MDWVKEAKRIFNIPKPEHFTNYKHCEECAEHDETLSNHSIDSISLLELGNPGWDPVCFCSDEGKKYYMPAFIRLSLESMGEEFYFGQLLFHLESDKKNNSFIQSCNAEQRKFVSDFVEFVINNYAAEIKLNSYEKETLKVYEIWSET